ncbi:MAG: class I SAM-dependent methyltransferase [Boseongicola sp.]
MKDAQTYIDVPAIDGIRYLRMLGGLHAALNPNWYLEVGTFKGRSLSKVDCNFVAVDPAFRLKAPLSHPGATQMHLFQQTSDDFFESKFAERNEIQFDFAFLDGLHHYEVLLRDFMNAEKLMSKGGVIALHDCCPSTVEMTSREQIQGAWTGDVWKTLLILLRNRPDLDIHVATASPTGLSVIRNLDPDNDVLFDRYDAIASEYDQIGIADLEGGIAGYYENFELREPEEVIGIFG